MRAAKIDNNQKQIVKQLRAIGASVAHTHNVHKGFPDIIVGYHGVNYLIEIKDGKKPPSQRKLTADQIIFHEGWMGQIAVCQSFEDVLAVIGQK